MLESFADLCINRNGLCVVKLLVAEATQPRHQELIMAKISPAAIDITCDPFGNYAVTEIITNWPQSVCAPIYEALRSNLSELCIQKYSSNVLERCFEQAPEPVRSQFV